MNSLRRPANDVRDAQWAPLNFLRASFFFLARSTTYPPFSGRSDHAYLTPQTSTLHLRPSRMVGRLDHLFHSSHRLLFQTFCKLGVGYSTASLCAKSSPVISHRLETYVSRAGRPRVANRHVEARRGSGVTSLDPTVGCRDNTLRWAGWISACVET